MIEKTMWEMARLEVKSTPVFAAKKNVNNQVDFRIGSIIQAEVWDQVDDRVPDALQSPVWGQVYE